MRRGSTLVEALVAGAVFALVVVPVLAALRTGAAGSARGGEHQLAALVAGRLDAAVVRAGRAGLARMGAGGAVELAALDRGGPLALTAAPGSGAGAAALELDGVRFTAELALDEPLAGLMRARLAVAWVPAGTAGPAQRLELVRLVADPLLEPEARP